MFSANAFASEPYSHGGQQCKIGNGMCLNCESGTVTDHGQTYVRCNSYGQEQAHLCSQIKNTAW